MSLTKEDAERGIKAYAERLAAEAPEYAKTNPLLATPTGQRLAVELVRWAFEAQATDYSIQQVLSDLASMYVSGLCNLIGSIDGTLEQKEVWVRKFAGHVAASAITTLATEPDLYVHHSDA